MTLQNNVSHNSSRFRQKARVYSKVRGRLYERVWSIMRLVGLCR
jgi:hypothetical protein